MIPSNLIKCLLVAILILLPTWGVISVQASFYSGVDQSIVSSVRYLFFTLVFFLGIVGLLSSNGKITSNYGFFLLFCYCVYVSAHILGEVEPLLLFEGVRHEVLFVFFSLVLLLYGLAAKHAGFLPSFDVVVASILINGFLACVFAIWQLVDISILELLYRKELDEIGNLTLAVGYRLASTMINPINFGAYMVLLLIAVQYLFEKRAISVLLYLILLIAIMALVFGSLSRLALLALVVVLLFYYLHRASIFRFLALLFVILLSILGMVSFFNLEPIITRISSLFVWETYTENARISNWLSAIASLDSYQYLWGRGIGASSPDSAIVSTTSALMVENGFISIFVQYGALGLILLTVLLIRIFYIGVKLLPEDPHMGRFALAFLIFFVVMSVGNDFFRNSPFVFYFWFLYAYFEVTMLVYKRRNTPANAPISLGG